MGEPNPFMDDSTLSVSGDTETNPFMGPVEDVSSPTWDEAKRYLPAAAYPLSLAAMAAVLGGVSASAHTRARARSTRASGGRT